MNEHFIKHNWGYQLIDPNCSLCVGVNQSEGGRYLRVQPEILYTISVLVLVLDLSWHGGSF